MPSEGSPKKANKEGSKRDQQRCSKTTSDYLPTVASLKERWIPNYEKRGISVNEFESPAIQVCGIFFSSLNFEVGNIIYNLTTNFEQELLQQYVQVTTNARELIDVLCKDVGESFFEFHSAITYLVGCYQLQVEIENVEQTMSLLSLSLLMIFGSMTTSSYRRTLIAQKKTLFKDSE